MPNWKDELRWHGIDATFRVEVEDPDGDCYANTSVEWDKSAASLPMGLRAAVEDWWNEDAGEAYAMGRIDDQQVRAADTRKEAMGL